ncbi:MAG: NTP transferase domain-containing protein [Candidatus Marinimicrobia bacterium]|nr:NTP transferase domain-containing protein [Candidatus Neomarinimicrobiota bacterium]MCF7851137.1 NTP transferase domain-containing protein [Candidatus Neomarinimicrobiota bacterium]MCF7904054.1 NTP transferase domain-containing protein [Candidatus Neomarinimicrobiota bacterium]
MRAVIPAAGIGKRLRPYTLEVPKVMISLAGKPLLGHILDAISLSGLTSISVIVGYLHEQVEDYVKESYSHLRLDFPFQAKRKGLGHAVLQGLEDTEDDVLILLGDTIFDVDFDKFRAREKNAIAVVKVDDPRRFGIAEVGHDMVVSRLVEKPEHPQSDLALAGMYYIKDQRRLKAALEKLIADDIRTRGEYQLTDALQLMIEQGDEIEAVEINGWYDCGTEESLLDSHRFLLDQSSKSDNPAGNEIIEPVFIHPKASVTDSRIGPYVTIDEGAVVSGSQVEDTIIGEYSVVENKELKHVLLAKQTRFDGDTPTAGRAD